jgi:type IV pilus assembly protein PilM
MAIQPGVWGIDLGQCALKAIRLQEIEGEVTATAFDYVEHPKILSQPDADPDQLTREALEKFLSRNTLRGDLVCISVPGQSGLARFVKLPPVEEKKISDIVRFEAKQQIPFNLDEVVWDYQKIGTGVVTDGFAMETEIGLFAMKRDMVNRYLQHFKDVGVEVNIVQMAPLSLCNFVAYDLLGKGAPGSQPPAAEGEEAPEVPEKTGCVVALDIGADASNLIITDGERIIWQRPIPLGGNHFTRALTKDLKLTFAKAEHLKRNATKSPDLKKILAALKPVLNDFVSEVQRSLAFFTNTHRDAQIDYMIGLGNAFRLPGLQRYLAEKLSLDVRKLAKMERMVGDAVVTQQVYTENILSFGVAYGLALQGLEKSRLVTNLLPSDIRFERLVRAKKPWAVAAAGALLLGTGAFAFSYYLEDRPYSDQRVVAAMQKADKAAKDARDWQTKFDSTKSAALAEEEAVKSIVAGQMERKNWLALLRFIDQALPRPDGSNITEYAKSLYWMRPPNAGNHPNPQRMMTGKQAWEKFKERQEGIKPMQVTGPEGGAVLFTTTLDDLGAGIDDLIQVNIEAIDCRFCDDLPGYWNGVRSYVKEGGFVRPRDQFDKPPEGKGWVVELRGFTFHHREDTFVVDTLVDNLARSGMPATYGGVGPDGLPLPGKAPEGTAAPAGGDKAAPAKPAAAPAGKPAAAPPEDPVINQISHVVLFLYTPTKTADTSTFQLIGNGVVAALTPGSSAAAANAPGMPSGAGGGMMGGGMMGGGMMGGGMMGGMGSNMMAARAPGVGGGGASARGNWVPLATATLGGGSSGRSSGSAAAPHSRTEFTVLFIWKEPTPSDKLRGMDSGPDAGGIKK